MLGLGFRLGLAILVIALIEGFSYKAMEFGRLVVFLVPLIVVVVVVVKCVFIEWI